MKTIPNTPVPSNMSAKKIVAEDVKGGLEGASAGKTIAGKWGAIIGGVVGAVAGSVSAACEISAAPSGQDLRINPKNGLNVVGATHNRIVLSLASTGFLKARQSPAAIAEAVLKEFHSYGENFQVPGIDTAFVVRVLEKIQHERGGGHQAFGDVVSKGIPESLRPKVKEIEEWLMKEAPMDAKELGAMITKEESNLLNSSSMNTVQEMQVEIFFSVLRHSAALWS